MKKGEQAFLRYAEASNAYLLEFYGFCYQDNPHDTFKFPLRIDMPFTKPVTVERMVTKSHFNKEKMQYCCLKKHFFSDTLMAYVRTTMKEEYFKDDDVESRPALSFEPVDLKFEQHCLKVYHQIIKKLVERTEKLTTLEEDMKMLAENPKERLAMALVYRSE